MPQQSPSAVLMVRPTSFGFDSQTAESNAFQHTLALSKEEILAKADAEFQQAVAKLRAHDINVTVFEDSVMPPKPNAVFPNNWLSMWPDGHIYLYPMATESRRVERSEKALDQLKDTYQITEAVDLSNVENEGIYLESTGVMIFDHVAKIVYGCVSVRCDEELFKHHATELGYTPFLFHAVDENDVPIYHTNVLMGVQTSTAVVCFDAIKDTVERNELEGLLRNTGHEIIAISHAQMNSFCGNVLELQNKNNEKILALSQTAYDTFTEEQRTALSRDKTLLPLAIPIIETIGGGSVRCMLAEIFLPSK